MTALCGYLYLDAYYVCAKIACEFLGLIPTTPSEGKQARVIFQEPPPLQVVCALLITLCVEGQSTKELLG